MFVGVKMQIFLRSQQLHCVQAEQSDAISSLKEKIRDAEGINIEEQVVYMFYYIFEI